MTDFLNVRLEDIPESRPAPEGDYLATVSRSFIGKISKDDGSETQYADVLFSLTSPLGDQDMADVNIKQARASYRMWLTENSLKMVREDFKRLGITDTSLSINDALELAKGTEVKVRVRYAKGKDGNVRLTKEGRPILEVQQNFKLA